MDQFRKVATIEVVKRNKNEVLVQNTGDSSDRWAIPNDVFEKTYEPVKSADYTILTANEREIIRTLLESILDNLLTLIVIQGKDKLEARDKFFEIQRRTGEEFKSFEDKRVFLSSELDKLAK